MTGNNIIAGNDIGVFARQYSNPFLGDAEAGTGGDNSIYSNVSYAVKAIEYCNILAQSNWWGDYPPSEEWFYADERSYIDYSYALENDPNEEMIARTFGNTIEGYEISRGSGADSLLRLARKYRFQKRPRLAIGIYRQLINKHGNTISARWGLVEILSAFKEARLDSSVNFLQRIKTTHSNGEVKRIANDMLTASLLRKGSISAAVSNCQEVLLQYPGTESEKLALFELFNIQLNIVQDSLQAREWLTILEQKYPDDKLTMIAQYQMGSGTAGNEIYLTGGDSAPSNMESSNSEIPRAFQLSQNYPNPFNPSTNITFAISKPGFVELKIYDLTGRQVRKLVSETKASGSYNVQWNGTDDEGKQVASGVYIYRVKTEEFVASRKMMLLR